MILPYKWSVSKCGKAYFAITPFGYGTRIAAETMAKLLDLQLSGWAESTNQKESFEKKPILIFNFGVTDDLPVDELPGFKVWVDCLMWLRDRLPENVRKYDMVLSETFFENSLKRYQESYIKHIPPLTYSPDTIAKTDENNEIILISFGGVETPFTTDTHRFKVPRQILKSICMALENQSDNRSVICCMPTHLQKELSEGMKLEKVKFCSPSHEQFIQLVKQSSLYFLQPGLYGPHEAFLSKIRTAFVTPFSYTQLCQARAFDRLNLLGEVPLWEELNSRIRTYQGNIESEEMDCFKELSTWLERRIGNESESIFIDWVKDMLSTNSESENLIRRREAYAAQSMATTSLEDCKDLFFEKLDRV